MFARRSSVVVAAIAVIVAFPPGLAGAQAPPLVVFAAASARNALNDVDDAFTRASRIKETASYDASSALIKRINGGAPADVFLSADTDWMDYGSKQHLIKDDTRFNLLGNQLVLIAAKTSTLSNVNIGPGFDLAKLAGNMRIVTGDVRTVPIGLYAKAALEKLGAWAAVEHKMAMTANVRVALSLVARGGRRSESSIRPVPSRSRT